MLKKGSTAPDFEAMLDDGSAFRLSQERGKRNVVLYFYPKDFSGGCTAQACSFRDNYSAISDYDAVIIGVSRDSAESHQRFKETHRLEYPIIADEDGQLADLYEVKSMLPVVRPRVTYVIDKQGVIRDAFRHDVLVTKHATDTMEALAAIQGTRGN